MKKIFNILLFLIISFYSISQDLPSICVGSTEKYWVNGFNGNSIFEWDIICPNGDIVSNDYYNIIGNGDTISVNWNDNLVGGIYTFNVKEYTKYGCIGEVYKQEIVLNSPTIYIPFDGVPESVSICYGDTAELYPGNFLSYLWQDNSTNDVYYTGESGTYQVKLIDNSYSCTYNEIENVVNPLPYVNLGNDTILFGNDILNLDIYNYNINEYLWSTGDISSSIRVDGYNGDQSIWVYVTDYNGCSNSDTINIKYLNDFYNLKIPKAFTPNGDGINDNWVFPVMDSNIILFDNIECNVYNRWGNKVWEYSGNDPRWNGRDLNNRQLPMDSYHYIIRFKLRGSVYLYRGTVTILL